jgi:hypothetical protein
MAKIQSTTPLIYDARKQASGIIRIEISVWSYDLKLKRYSAVVEDFIIEEVTEDGVSFELPTLINSKTVYYPVNEINALFTLIGKPINVDAVYSQEMDGLISEALLKITQTDPIYGSVPENWQTIE